MINNTLSNCRRNIFWNRKIKSIEVLEVFKLAPFGLPYIRLVRLVFSARTVFFSHNNSARTVFFNQFQPSFSEPNGATWLVSASTSADKFPQTANWNQILSLNKVHTIPPESWRFHLITYLGYTRCNKLLLRTQSWSCMKLQAAPLFNHCIQQPNNMQVQH